MIYDEINIKIEMNSWTNTKFNNFIWKKKICFFFLPILLALIELIKRKHQ